MNDVHGVRGALSGSSVSGYRLDQLTSRGLPDPSRLPITVKILLENSLRHAHAPFANADDVAALAGWNGKVGQEAKERPFAPARVLLQDLTGVPAVVDLAALRGAVADAGGNPSAIDPLVPVDLVIDHSVQVDWYATAESYERNIEREFERNTERYSLLRWAQGAFKTFRVVPPGMGIVHQINLEYLASVVTRAKDADGEIAYPDTLVGTDSHTPMVNGIGVLGWGVGGIEAEAVMLGQPLFLLPPVVVGVKFVGELPTGTTATDLVLMVTERLRAHGVVGSFVEFCGDGLSSLPAADRATLSNMAPEYGATAALFPVDEGTLTYLRGSGRAEEAVELVERYTKDQGMFRSDGDETPLFSELLEFDLADVVPSLAGPRRPQDRVRLPDVPSSFTSFLSSTPTPATAPTAHEATGKGPVDGDVVIAAITSCTNTSNPSVMVAAGLLAQKARAAGLKVPAHVKTSLAPGSRVVTRYLERAGLMDDLSALGFDLVGYGCTTCIGNSGPLDESVAKAIDEGGLSVTAVLSGNRNFEGRIHPQVKASYLASPPLVVAYALAGSVTRDLTCEPIGKGKGGKDVMLDAIWPTRDEVVAAVRKGLGRDLYDEEYSTIFDGDEHWKKLDSPKGALFDWNPESTYIRRPPFVDTALTTARLALPILTSMRVLAVLADSITTDHISPAGAISPTSPAARWLNEQGVERRDFNTYGSRRGNHEVMVRGTLANIRLRNILADGAEGPVTRDFTSGDIVPIYDAAAHYLERGVPLVILAGKEYGSGSSRDWAAKGTLLLGVRVVIAQSYERIHRSNLVGMGVLPLQFVDDQSVESLGLTGRESFDVTGNPLESPQVRLTVVATDEYGQQIEFEATTRLDSATDIDYYRNGGVLPTVLRSLAPAAGVTLPQK